MVGSAECRFPEFIRFKCQFKNGFLLFIALLWNGIEVIVPYETGAQYEKLNPMHLLPV